MFCILLRTPMICETDSDSNSTKAIYIPDQPRYLNTRADLHIISFYNARFLLGSHGLPSG